MCPCVSSPLRIEKEKFSRAQNRIKIVVSSGPLTCNRLLCGDVGKRRGGEEDGAAFRGAKKAMSAVINCGEMSDISGERRVVPL